MGKINPMIQWFKDREGKVTYDQGARYGDASYDCSSAVFYALIAGGFRPKGSFIGNTETLYSLEGTLLTPIARSQVQRGDIFVAGVKGGSGGNFGHTGVALDNNTIIHCNGSANGISTTPITNANTGTPVYWYRLVGIEDETTKKEETYGGEDMFIYKKGDEIWWVMGGNRLHLQNAEQVEHATNIIKNAYRDMGNPNPPCRQYLNWKVGGEQLKIVEAMFTEKKWS